MKKFIWKCGLFSVLICAACACFLFLSAKEPFRPMLARLTNSQEFLEDSGMLPYFERAVESDGTTRLIIGDSICRQMFSPLEVYNPDKSVLATNAALMMPGQYLLAREYLRSHPDTTDVFLVMHPLTLTRTFDMEWGYRYAAMTYVETEGLPFLDQSTRDAMEEAYGSVFLTKGAVWMMEYSPVCRKIGLNYLQSCRQPYAQGHPFEIADLYVEKLFDLCREYGAELRLYASPVSEYYREEMENLAEAYGETGMSRLFPDYMKNIWYFPQDWTEDQSHFSGEYASRERLNEIIGQAYGNTVLWDSLNVTHPNAD
ncbi:MAG: hypothetical protein HFH80_02595 [Lachnospiraceae bacterium]|nr:hypothetical protein [Lachnospiraceae bacterium]